MLLVAVEIWIGCWFIVVLFTRKVIGALSCFTEIHVLFGRLDSCWLRLYANYMRQYWVVLVCVVGLIMFGWIWRGYYWTMARCC